MRRWPGTDPATVPRFRPPIAALRPELTNFVLAVPGVLIHPPPSSLTSWLGASFQRGGMTKNPIPPSSYNPPCHYPAPDILRGAPPLVSSSAGIVLKQRTPTGADSRVSARENGPGRRIGMRTPALRPWRTSGTGGAGIGPQGRAWDAGEKG